jgi:hypothetical protein
MIATSDRPSRLCKICNGLCVIEIDVEMNDGTHIYYCTVDCFIVDHPFMKDDWEKSKEKLMKENND